MSQDRVQDQGDRQHNQEIRASQTEPLKELQWLANYFRTHGRNDISEEISQQLDRFQKPESQTPMHGGASDPE